MSLDYNSPESLAPVIEALLFASDEPLSANDLRDLILGEDFEKKSSATDSTDGESEETASTNGQAAEAEVTAEATEAAPSAEAVAAPGDEDNTTEEQPKESMSMAEMMKKAKRKKKYPFELPVIHDSVEHLNQFYTEHSSAFRIVAIAGGYQFATRPEYSDYVVRLFKEKSRRRLSGASLETLAIIAYKQPVSKQDIENIRGVNCDEVVKSLLEKNLITITGRAEAVGRPLLYGTTTEFLRHFGLHTLSDLPKPREIEELLKEEAVKATTLEEAANEFVSPQPGGDHVTVDEAVAFLKANESNSEEDTMTDEASSTIEDSTTVNPQITDAVVNAQITDSIVNAQITDAVNSQITDVVNPQITDSVIDEQDDNATHGIELDIDAMDENLDEENEVEESEVNDIEDTITAVESSEEQD